jgi:hypothetical protein
MDPRKLGGGGVLQEAIDNLEHGMPQELLMSDTNILAMRVPNFSYREEAGTKI